MGSQISKLISVRVATNAAIAIEHEATRSGKSVKEIIEILGMDIDGGQLRCNGDSLVPPDEYMEEIAPEGEYEQLGFDKILEAYRRCGYPEAAIRQQNEMIAGMIRNNGKFSGKRFSDDPC